MFDYDARNLVFVAAAKVAAANPDCVTGFSIVRDTCGYCVAFENYHNGMLRRNQVRITETELACMSTTEQVLNHMLTTRVESLRRQLHGKKEEDQTTGKESL